LYRANSEYSSGPYSPGPDPHHDHPFTPLFPTLKVNKFTIAIKTQLTATNKCNLIPTNDALWNNPKYDFLLVKRKARIFGTLRKYAQVQMSSRAKEIAPVGEKALTIFLGNFLGKKF